MTISLTNAGKRFNREWIFRNFSYEFAAGHSYAITGPNGSGKSTLLQIIGGAMNLSEGVLSYALSNSKLPGTDSGNQELFRFISFAAPYLELVEEMTLSEFLGFHARFKPLLPGITVAQAISAVGLESASGKQIRYFSSGMKQRLKLAQAVFSDTPGVLLDEPSTNLDEAGTRMYQDLVRRYCLSRLLIISSNDEAEYGFCQEVLTITDWKKTAQRKE